MQAWRPDCPPIRLVHIEDAGNALQEHDWLPDLSDPLTALGLLALVRERWGVAAHCMQAVDCCWYVWVEFRLVAGANTETEALIAALEATP